jgi:erythromycin esterase-like protein
MVQAAVVDAVKRHAITAKTASEFTSAIVERIPQHARFVLIGEASHGTREFYQQRAEISKLLIEERGFDAVLAESDFPDAYRVNKYVRGLSKDQTANEALGEYTVSLLTQSRLTCHTG